MEVCRLCPRSCGVDRKLHTGYCGQTETIRIARAALHFWEEPCISGTRGSGTVFFSGCPLRCVFCQNRDIALGENGLAITKERLTEIFLELQEQGAHNINLVTPTHYVPQIAECLKRAKEEGLHIPVVYNTGSYETSEALRLLEGLVDVYLPDLKYADPKLSARLSNAPDYFACATAAIAEMVRQVGEPVFDEEDLMTRGVIIRHLVLPEHVEDSKRVIRYVHETYGDAVFLSIMNQYTPLQTEDTEKARRFAAQYPELTRKLSEEEYDETVDYAIEIGVENGFIQEGETAEESFIPPFDHTGVLKEE